MNNINVFRRAKLYDFMGQAREKRYYLERKKNTVTTICEKAYAKINLTLDVLGKREDGYHDLQSIMQTVSLHDTVEITVGTGKPWRLRCDKEDIPEDMRNLAWKAAAVFFAAGNMNPDGLEIRITKRIPSQAGLGGGSADAAAVLRALNRHYGNIFSTAALAELGAKVGSDVPFCTLCGCAMAEGRGERLREMPGMPSCWIVICKPPFSASTPELYRKLEETVIQRRPNQILVEQGLREGNLRMIAPNVCNVFEQVVTASHSEIGEIKKVFAHCGSIGQQMSGSGSAVFGIFDCRENAESAVEQLKAQYSDVFLAQPV